jgi:hypothetical protein
MERQMIALLGLIPLRFWAYGAAVLAIVVGTGIAINHFESVGAADATAKIERANNALEKKADNAQAPIDTCLSAGGHWNRDKWLCVTVSPSY